MVRPLSLTPELVALCHRDVPRPSTSHRFTMATPEDHAATAERLLREAGDGPLRVFAYGSLIWKPGVDIRSRTKGVALGWRRTFGLRVEGARGTPEAPGYMLTLTRGGSCRGILLEPAEREEAMHALVARELPMVEMQDQVRWLKVATAEGPVRALGFWAGRFAPMDSTSLSTEVIAVDLARACGYFGSGAEYLYQTIVGLREYGIDDPYLWRVQHMVAGHIKAMQATLAPV